MKLDLNKLRIAQVRACLSVDEIVEKTGLSRATVSKTINGKIYPTPKTIGLLTKALNVDVTEIIVNEEE
ncbi:helix-turn-helix transcriptional regulator [Clostridium sp.]|uniref:helix-turn-helix domain-containing protein n=1 Tax=Clostridium sp. TaxID=1506 RepID=UPI00290EE05D|nr:helix-turn-helix transcriptional regulator [Clostridium sp.]MDU4142728.1 helix-turn-helix transcriptional regulator [Clostridium sp.]